MAFEILPATIDDIPEIVRVFHESFAEDTDFVACYGGMDPYQLERFHIEHFTNLFHHRWIHYFKAIDIQTRKIVGYSEWQFPHTAAEADDALEKEAENPLSWYLIEGLNVPLCVELSSQSTRVKEDGWFDQETDFYLEVLAVRPRYRRLGLGSLLVRAGLDAADKTGARAYTEASDLGRQLYERLDFKAVAEINVDLRNHGGEEVMTEVCMIRDTFCEVSLN